MRRARTANWRSATRPGLLGGALVAGLLVACVQHPTPDPGPLGSLEAAELSATYDSLYWHGQAAADSDVWQAALDFCRENEERPLPNCAIVMMASFIRALEDAAEQPFPEYPSADKKNSLTWDEE